MPGRGSNFIMNKVIFGLLALWLGFSGPPAGARPQWGHRPSPYRAEFTVLSQPNSPKAGYFLAVPVCGLGDADGKNVFVTDAKGRRLTAWAMGPTRNNSALLVCSGNFKNDSRLYAYWGSSQIAPQNKMSFTPGLTVTIRTAVPNGDITSWAASQRMLRASRRLGIIPIKDIELSTNPIDATDAMIMDFNGSLKIAHAQTWHFFLASDDAGYLLVNNQTAPLIDRSNRHWAHDDRLGKGRRSCRLRAGLNKVRCIVIDIGGQQMAVLARWVNDRKKFKVPADAFVQSGSTRLEKVETRGKKQVCPAFSTRLVSYIGVNQYYFTEYELKTYTGDEVTWKLSNGMRGKSAVFVQLIVGGKGLGVEAVGKGRVTARGRILLAGVPRQLSWRDRSAYAHYAELMRVQALTNLEPAYVEAYLHFFNLYERNPAAVKFCEYLLAAKTATGQQRPRLYLNLARTAAAKEPGKARRAYAWLLKHRPRRGQAAKLDSNALTLEYFEFELYRGQKPKAVAKALALVKSKLGANSSHYRRCAAEFTLMNGKIEEAKKQLEELRSKVVAGSHRTSAVRANSLLEQYKLQLRTGYYAQAENTLRQWIELAPDALLTGQYALMRGRCLRRFRWRAGAGQLLKQTLIMNPLAPFLPDMEYDRAVLLKELKKNKEARDLFQSIRKQYPNHPVAEQARLRLIDL